MKITGTPGEIVDRFLQDAPNTPAPQAVDAAKRHIAPGHSQLLDWQGVALYALARPYDRVGAHILEIGTAAGFSASVLRLACSRAGITTLNPIEHEVKATAQRLSEWGITSLQIRSWDYLAIYHGPELDLIWIDGDHKRAVMDLPWYRWLRPHGLLLLHDWSPQRCPPVFAAVQDLGEQLGREPDVQLMDDAGNGMAGFYKM